MKRSSILTALILTILASFALAPASASAAVKTGRFTHKTTESPSVFGVASTNLRASGRTASISATTIRVAPRAGTGTYLLGLSYSVYCRKAGTNGYTVTQKSRSSLTLREGTIKTIKTRARVLRCKAGHTADVPDLYVDMGMIEKLAPVGIYSSSVYLHF